MGDDRDINEATDELEDLSIGGKPGLGLNVNAKEFVPTIGLKNAIERDPGCQKSEKDLHSDGN